ncbi:hypothetical protein ACTG9Q_13455 [Actinokineospora sp. 24-640]
MREQFCNEFRETLGKLSILSGEQLNGLFTDWWAANREDLDQLRTPDVLLPEMRKKIAEMIGFDLLARTEKLVARERQRLVDIYRAWGDNHAISLAHLERRREAVAARLAERLRDLNYQWPSATGDEQL